MTLSSLLHILSPLYVIKGERYVLSFSRLILWLCHEEFFMLLNHIQFVIGDTVVEHLNDEDANDLLTSTIWWMEEVECPHTLSEIDDFQDSILDRMKDMLPIKKENKTIYETQAPPLGDTPMPVVNQAQMVQKDPITNLTRTETALLSPTEKVIAGRT